MRCPVDDAVLVMSSREGVEIDYCPECRGVWLDRGELDKIIDRAASPSAAARPDERYRDDARTDAPRHDPRAQARPKRKESFLSDLFDFG